MGRPSVLTEPMKADITKLIAEGVPIREVARKFKVGEATLRRNFSAQVPVVKDVAQRLATAERDLAHLPISAQRAARTLADQLKSIQDDYASVAARSTKTAVKVANLAGKIVDGIAEDSFQAEDVSKLAAVDVLSKTMNQALQPAANLIAANKPKDQGQAGGGLEQLLSESWESK